MTTQCVPSAVFCTQDLLARVRRQYPSSVPIGELSLTDEKATFSTPKVPAHPRRSEMEQRAIAAILADKSSSAPAATKPPTELQAALSPNVAKFVMAQRAGKAKAGDLRTAGQATVASELQAALSPALAKFVSAQRAAKAKR